MNYSWNMKGWKRRMENNTTTYGRKVIREERIRKQKAAANRNFIVFTFMVLAIGMAIGAIIMFGVCKNEKSEAETISENEYIMQYVNQYGAYDGRVFTSEMSMDWSGDEYEFTPLDCKLDAETQEFVFYLCKGYDIDWTLVMAIMQQESSFRSDVISDSNDYGLMQINKVNHEWLTETLGVTDFTDPHQNIRAGVFILRKLFEQYTEPNLVLMSYNMGQTGAARLWKEGIYSTPYVENILKYQAEFNEQLEGKEGTN